MIESRIFHPEKSSKMAPGDSLLNELGIQPKTVVKNIKQGFPVVVIDRMVKEMRISQVKLLEIINITSATLTRRRQSKKPFNSQESDRLYRVANAYHNAVKLFEGDRNNARRWLNEPAKALGGKTPLEHLDTEAGAKEIQNLIGRLEHGVFT